MTTYYVDATNGDNGKNGQSPENAWQTLAYAMAQSFNYGDSILLKRGEVWREPFNAPVPGGTGSPANMFVIGAYGTGNKPLILGSKDYDSASWTSMGGNLYHTPNGSFPNDAGMLYYNTNTTIGFGSKKTSQGACTANWDFWHDTTNNRVVVYHSGGAPNTQANGLEITSDNGSLQHIINVTENYTRIENLEVKYANAHGLKFASVTGSEAYSITATYCGGRYLSGTDRYGNGIEINYRGDNCTVSHCTVSECYDSGITFQASSGTASFSNSVYEHNTIFNCCCLFEVSYWGGGPTCSGTVIRYNTMYAAGQGWSGTSGYGNGRGLYFNSGGTTGATIDVSVYGNLIYGPSNSQLVRVSMDISSMLFNIHHNWIKDSGTIGIYVGNPDDSPTVNVWANIFERNSHCGIYVNSLNGTVRIFNNSFYGNDHPTEADGKGNVVIAQAIENLYIKNNAYHAVDKYCYVNEQDYTGRTEPTEIDHNVYFSDIDDVISYGSTPVVYGSGDLAAYQAACGAEANSQFANPDFYSPADDKFYLKEYSPCIDKGENLGSSYDSGLNWKTTIPDLIIRLNQNSQGSGWEIGAYVYISTGAFEELLKKPASQKVVLCEVEPYEHLTSWTKTGGYTNVYEKTLSKKPYSDRDISRVRENLNTWYGKRYNIEDVDAIAGSFYYDYVSEKLYIHTSGSTAPSNYTICAYFWLYFAKETKKAFTINGSQGFLHDDGQSGHTVTNHNDLVSIDQATRKFGISSAAFDGTTNCDLNIADHNDWWYDDDSFTIECYVKMNTLASYAGLVAQNEGSSYIIFRFSPTNGLEFTFLEYGVGSFLLNQGSTTGWDTTKWHHVAVCKNGTTVELFMDGSRVANGTTSYDLPNLSNSLYIGCQTNTNYLDGKMDEIRISLDRSGSGGQRYSGTSYTVPTGPFTSDSYTVLLLHLDIEKPVYFEPLLNSAPTIRRKCGNVAESGGESATIGDLVLNNSVGEDGTGPFDDVFYDWLWLSARVRERIGGEDLAYSEYQLEGEYRIDEIGKNFEEIIFKLADVREFLERQLPTSVYDKTTYPNLEEGKEGMVIPLIWGLVRNIIPTCIVTQTLEYQVCSHMCLVLGVYDDDVRVGFLLQNSSGKFALNASPVGLLTCDVVGKVDSTNLINNPDFESFTGTADDNVTDTFTNWSNNVTSPDKILAMDFSKEGSPTETHTCRLLKGDAVARWIYVTTTESLEANQWYRLALWGRTGYTSAGTFNPAGPWTHIGNGCYVDESVTGQSYSISKVTEDGGELTKVKTWQECYDTVGTWYYNLWSDKLYLHCTDGLSPTTHTIVCTKKRYDGDNPKIMFRIQNSSSNPYLQDDHRSWTNVSNFMPEYLQSPSENTDYFGVSLPFKTVISGTHTIQIGFFEFYEADAYGDIDYVYLGKTEEVAGAIAKDICDNHIDLESELYDEDSLDDIDEDAPYPIGIILEQKTSLKQVLEKTLNPFGRYFINRDGKLALRQWANPDGTDPGLISYDRFNFMGLREVMKSAVIYWKVNIGWGQSITKNFWNYEDSSNSTARYLYPTAKELTVETKLSYQNDASDVADAILALLKNRRLEVSLRAQLKAHYSDLGNEISVTRTRFNKATETYLEVLEKNIDHNRGETLMETFRMLSS